MYSLEHMFWILFSIPIQVKIKARAKLKIINPIVTIF